MRLYLETIKDDMTDIEKKAAKLQNTIFMCYTTIEILLAIVLPIWAWGWKIGLVVIIALTNLLNLVAVLKRLIVVMNARPAAAPSMKGGRIVIP